VEVEYVVPYLAHAAMEPMDCVITPHGGAPGEIRGVRIINGEQFQSIDQQAVAAVLGLLPEQVRIEMLYAGTAFESALVVDEIDQTSATAPGAQRR
jgi:isoquinoline 1-oxidoreductase beta subunit